MTPEQIAAAKAAYSAETANHPTIHCNRFPAWDELAESERERRVRDYLEKEPHP